MRIRPTHRVLVGALGGVAVAAAAGAMMPVPEASARARGGQLRLIDINVGAFSGVYQNEILEMTFTSEVNPRTVNPAVLQVRQQNATRTGYTIQVAGSFQVVGSVIRFYPRLPTHLRDPKSSTGAFYPPGDARDNAEENAAFQPSKNYQVKILGNPHVAAVQSTKGRRLSRTYAKTFTTSPASPKTDAFTSRTYQDAPPPGFEFSNPPDKVASAADQYARHGGTREVPNEIAVTLFGNKVPLSPSTVRAGQNVSLTMTERDGDTSLRKPIRGRTYVEQNFDTVRLIYQPFFPLPDRGTYALRITKDVKDLTEQYNFKNNAERLRLREIYEFMSAARLNAPGVPYENLGDPPAELVYDWPSSDVERGTLKRNVLVLGDTYPDEVDPRVMVLFTTRDEPVSQGSHVIEFIKAEAPTLFDAQASTGSWDDLIPGAASAILTVAAGNGTDGDYAPVSNETINVDSFPNRTINWRKVVIPSGIVITLRGSRAATLKAYAMQLDGVIQADGLPGETNTTATPAQTTTTSTTKPAVRRGGLGGPGGGKGGDTSDFYYYPTYNTYETPSNPGVPGVDEFGVTLAPADGGRGGLGGGGNSSGTYYKFGGGGGGGGARLAGANGNGTAYYAAWDGPGGAGGAGSTNDDLSPLGGGAGGGSGGNSAWNSGTTAWANNGGGGGGGGGAVLIQTAGLFTVGTTGNVRARGGVGGNGPGTGSYGTTAGAGGGGGGGSVLLRSTKGFNLANAAAAVDVRGGNGGTAPAQGSPIGGVGGAGYIRLEDPNGGFTVPGGTSGLYMPVGGGGPSVIYTKFADVGVDQPRFVNFTPESFLLNATNNDAILIEIQAAIEDTKNFGVPKLTALLANQNSSNEAEVSRWYAVRLVDKTNRPGGAFGQKNGQVPGYDPNRGDDQVIPIADKINGKNYKFFRYRITFQLDDTSSVSDPLPFVDRLQTDFQFNF